MPAIIESGTEGLTELPFPPVTKAHILNCSYHSWHPKYRAITPKSRTVPLSRPFVDYLRADGIILPDDEDEQQPEWDSDSGIFSASDNPEGQDDAEFEEQDVAAEWRPIHDAIKRTIGDLGGIVVPKLNWSAPKDATWMNATNSMECRSPNDIYLLLKSSDFVTHDLEHAFDDTVNSPESSMDPSDIPYHLVLRKHFQMNPSVEFRCFVRGRKLLCICQRDLNHFDFLFQMKEKLQSLIQEFFDVRLRDSFPDENFVFDCYVPAPYTKVWLVDVNPWAPRTDPLLYSWMEVLKMPDPPEVDSKDDAPEQFARLYIRPTSNNTSSSISDNAETKLDQEDTPPSDDDSDSDSSVDEEFWLPELRLVKKSDPEAYTFNTPQYSAHKLPKDVVDASQSGEGLREFARDWQNILAKRQQDDAEADSSEGE
ncbi:D123-domain-containing protein [Hortaea werneckii]|uniref:Uncharacterized protein n=1 Tax=Hortaea werneckii TaxID=91943 RepID=A0A3M7CPD0_HORWE|nr:D123-domain-containing protein [Hortaea werneckii]KAI7720449.1 D123-domain-containing protein [Hortaea werneckii]RMY53882.1 hypothetical protein D0865_05018 [Hortaea werneckii]